MKHKILLAMSLILALMVGTGILLPQEVRGAPMTTFLPPVTVTELPLQAAALRQTAVLSPKGTHISYLTKREQLCVYSSGGDQRFCTDYDRSEVVPDTESFAWSPDERYVAFTADFFVYLRNPGLWLLNVETGELTQLSGADDRGKNIMKNDDPYTGIDVSPTWLPDSSGFYFVRYVAKQGADYAPYLYRYDLAEGKFEELRALQPADRFGILQLRLHPDGEQIVYNVEYTQDKTHLGLWSSTISGDEPARHLLQVPDESYAPRVINFSADGTLLLTKNSIDMQQPSITTPEKSPVRIVDLATGESLLVNDSLPVRYAGWSPEGDGIAYIVYDPKVPERSGLYVRSQLGGESRHLLTGWFVPPTPGTRQPIIWASNNTILLADRERGFNLIVVTLNLSSS